MTFKQISTILNNVLTKNEIGQQLTIAEDLSNIIDLGTLVADMDDATLKDFNEKLAVGVVRNVFETKALNIEDYGLFRDSQEFGGAIQRIKMSMDNFSAQDMVLYTLENGQDYFDGKYYGADPDAKLYTKESGFDVPWSIPNEKFKAMFKSADEVGNYISLIEQTLMNYVTFQRTLLAKRVLNGIMQSAIEGNRVINLVTLYNARHDAAAAVTTNTCLTSPEFLRWAYMLISLTADRMKVVNKKYNDGTIETFTNASDIRITLLSEFEKAASVVMMSDVYHDEKVSLGKQYNTAPYWQNSSTELAPTLGKTAELVIGTAEDSETYSNIIGCVYDYYTGGITQKLNKITNQYIAKGDYTTFFQHIDDRYFIDSRNAAVVFTLN